jgi:hypothetical protein
VGRRSVWSDPEVVKLARKFVAAADEVGHLQRARTTGPEAEWFRTVAEQGHYAGRTTPTDTRQGIYAAAPSGVLLASINHNDPKRVAGMLRKALAAWVSMPRSERLPPEAAPEDPAGRVRWETLHPEKGLVLRVTSRDAGRERVDGDDWRANAWNLDALWFRAEEAASFVPAEAKVGATADVPAALVRRIVRLHLTDNVRGQTPPYPDRAVERAALRSEVTAVEGDRVSLRLSGEARVVHEGRWPVGGFRDMHSPSEQERGFEGRLLGRASYDRKAARFVAFEMVALGSRWGATQYNGRHDDPGPAPMGVVFSLAGDTPADRVAPSAMWEYGWGPPR